MIKSGTRVSNPKGTGGFEFVRDVHAGEYMDPDDVKPYGNQRKPKRGDKIPKWFNDWLLYGRFESEPQPPLDYPIEHLIPVVYQYETDDSVYSVEHDEYYHVQLATLRDGEYYSKNILTTRSLWFAKLYARFHAVLP